MFPANPEVSRTPGRTSTAGYTRLPPAPSGVRFTAPAAYHGETYYDVPAIKHSHYKWRTAVAFFCNGLAGGAQLIATNADLFGGGQGRGIVRAGRWLAFAGGSVSAITLISSLHTRQRWYNMLRIFKPTSPMSIGIWTITPFTLLSGFAAAGQMIADAGFGRAGRWMGRGFGLPAAALGALVMSYMGTELEETNMPVWASAHPAMAPLYAAAGMANASAALLLMTGPDKASDTPQRGLKKLAFVSAAAETTLGTFLDAGWRRKPENRAFFTSAYGTWFRIVESGWVGSLALRLLDGVDQDRRPAAGTLSSLLKLAGGLLAQVVMVYAGRESGRQAIDYFEYTRAADPGNGMQRPQLPKAEKAALIRMARATSADTGPTPRRRSSSLDVAMGLGILALGAAVFIPPINKRREASHETIHS